MLRVLNDISKRSGSQAFFHGPLRIHKMPVKNIMDVSPYRTVGIRLLVEMEETFLIVHTTDGFINIEQSDFVKPFRQLSATASALCLNDSSFP